MYTIHPKVWVPTLVLLICSAGLTGLAAYSDDVSWKVPATAFITAVLQGVIGFLKSAGVEGLKVDAESLSTADVRSALKGKV